MSTVPDDFSPRVCGDTLKPFCPSFVTLDAQGAVVPYALTGLTLSMEMVSESGQVKTCNGTWTTVDASGGKAQYHYQAGDVDTPGTWTKHIKFTDGNGEVQHTELKVLEILPLR